MRKVTMEELLEHLSPDLHDHIADSASRFGATHVVLFENPTLDSSRRGDGTILMIGPHCTYKNIGEVEGKHLYDLPSMRQYPTMYAEV